MAIQPESIESGKVSGSPVDEKHNIDSEIASVDDSFQEDEALELVGKERTQEFTEEYNRRLRRKLVSDLSPRYSVHNLISVIGPDHTTNLRGGLFYPVSVCWIYYSCASLTHFVQ